MELENIANWPILGVFKVVSRNHNDLLIRDVDGSAEPQLLVETVVLLVLDVLGRIEVPFLAGLRAKLGLRTNCVQISVHYETTGILEELVLLLHMRTVPNADCAHDVRHDAIIKLPR